MRQLIARHKYIFLAGALAGLLLRLLFLFRWPHVQGDSLIYIDIATNWLLQGIYGMTEAGGVVTPTYIRLPGYPAFLAASFALFGIESLRAALILQSLADLATCFVVAAIAYETFAGKPWRDAAAIATFLLAALCPFTANYAALPLTEALEMLCTALAILFAVRGVKALSARSELNAAQHNAAQSHPHTWVACGLAIGAAIMLRPDGGLLLIAAGLYLLSLLWRAARAKSPKAQPPATRALIQISANARQVVIAGLLVAAFACLPMVPWATRNWRTFHEFRPLVPRYTTEAHEYIPLGFIRWMKTWTIDYVSVEDVGFKISADSPGEAVDLQKLPTRAFDSDQQRAQTAALFDEFNATLILAPETDAKFLALANERIAHSHFRYYVWLPLARLGDMWLRPRTEMLPLEQRWWEFQDNTESGISIGFAAWNLLLLLAAVVGALRFRQINLPGYGLMLGFVALRSLFLMTIENPEPRYTLECYPVVFVFAGAALAWMLSKFRSA